MAADLKTDVLIVGAGFAGASTAYHLSRSYSGSILLIEKEQIPGFHASGRNASLVHQSTENPEIRALIAASTHHYTKHRERIGFQQQGSLLLGKENQLSRTRDPELIATEYRDPQQSLEMVPLLRGHDFEAALWTPSDGVMDVSALLQFYLEGARSRGVTMWLDCEFMEVKDHGPYRLQTSRGLVESRFLINAAGAWATEVARLCQATQLPLSPLKRHLFVIDMKDIDPTWPFVWDVDKEFYFRPESGGLLFSICDEESSESLEPVVNPDISQALAELVWVELPALREATQREVWSCFRTKTPDGLFVIGWDDKAEGFFWVGGLGGHGMGSSWEVGRLAAERFIGGDRSQQGLFSPSRFQLTTHK